MNRKTFNRCYSLAKRMAILMDAILEAPEGGYLQRVLESEHKTLQDELWAKAKFHASKFDDMVWKARNMKDYYDNAYWLELRLKRTHYLARDLRDKMHRMITLIQYGTLDEIPF